MGFSVLDLSKLHMYNFHYNHIKYPRPDLLRLLSTDKGSFAYAAQTEDTYIDMAGDAASHYDYCEYPLDHPYIVL